MQAVKCLVIKPFNQPAVSQLVNQSVNQQSHSHSVDEGYKIIIKKAASREEKSGAKQNTPNQL